MAAEISCGQDQARNSDYHLQSKSELRRPGESLSINESYKITSNFPQTSASCVANAIMTSQEHTSGGSDGMVTTTLDKDVTQGVQTLKALSLNGLNRNACQSSVVTADDNDDSHMLAATDGSDGRPKARLSWGDVTEIPDNGATSRTHEYEKHSGLQMGGASSNGNPWQVRSTQNPSRPLVRRPTPMAIKVPKSVLGSAKKATDSFAEEEENEEDNDDGCVPVSLKESTNVDVLVVEDVEDIGNETPSPGSGLTIPKDLPFEPIQESQVLNVQQTLDAGSPTIVVQTEIGKQLSLEEAEEEEEEEEANAEEEEEDEFNVDDDKFLSPTKSESYTKKPEPPTVNSHVQVIPHKTKKLVRRQTPITLELPKDLKSAMSSKKSDEIIEEEEEEEEEEKEENAKGELISQNAAESTTPTNIEDSSTEIPVQDDEVLKGSSKETELSTNALDSSECFENNNGVTAVSGRPDIINSVNCNNNNREASSLDLVDETVKGTSEEGVQETDKLQMSASPITKNRFRKSDSRDKNNGSGSPSSARRKVSPHHTKILKRQLTPLQIEVPKDALKEVMKSKSPRDAFLEVEEEEES